MVKVKIIKDTEFRELQKYLGQIYEAFIDKYSANEEGYCINFEDKINFVPKEYCEVIKETIDTKKVLLVEDGSVDVDYIEDELGIKCIIYRQGANKPEWLDIGE